MQISDETIQAVKQIDILEVASKYTVLKKSGKSYLALCPFHDEKTPSLSISQEKGLYHCFGCGASGDVIKFYQEINNKTFSESIVELAEEYNIEIKTINSSEQIAYKQSQTEKERLYEVLDLAKHYFSYILYRPVGKKALEYLSERGLHGTTIKTFNIGYAPEGWEHLYRYFSEVKRYSPDLLVKAGLIKPRQGDGFYDIFRNRIIIPLHDKQGRVIGFNGRIVPWTEDKPKYLHSADSLIFKKSDELFNLHRAKDSIRTKDAAILVEGVFDVMSLHQAGYSNAIAALGTHCTDTQAKMVLKYCESKTMYLNFDADVAGEKATEKVGETLDSLVNSGLMNLKIVNLPSQIKDVDEYLRVGQQYKDLLNSATPFLDWRISRIFADGDIADAFSKKKVWEQAVTILNHIYDEILYDHYTKKIAELFAADNPSLIGKYINQLNRTRRPVKREGVKPVMASPQPTPAEPLYILEFESITTGRVILELDILNIYLNHPDQREYIFNSIEFGSTPLLSDKRSCWLWSQIKNHQPEDWILCDHLNTKILNNLKVEIKGNREYFDNIFLSMGKWQDDVDIALNHRINQITKKNLEDELIRLIALLKHIDNTKLDELTDIYRQITEISEKIKVNTKA